MANHKPVRKGDKVKVYSGKKASTEMVWYGEVVSVGSNHVLMIKERPDFSSLPVSSFDHYRELPQVRFVGSVSRSPIRRPDAWKQTGSSTNQADQAGRFITTSSGKVAWLITGKALGVLLIMLLLSCSVQGQSYHAKKMRTEKRMHRKQHGGPVLWVKLKHKIQYARKRRKAVIRD